MSALLENIEVPRLPRRASPGRVPLPQTDASVETITQAWVWTRLAHFLKAGDIVIAESGTAQFGFPDAHLPPDVTYITQVYYGSIGYSVPACLGAALAHRDQRRPHGRVILAVGDGSLQLTVQEIGTMIKLGLKNIIM